MELYVLLYFVNEYNQEGGYFSGIFSSYEEAVKVVDHIGRKNWENEWYEIKKVRLNIFTGIIYE